MTPIPSTQRKTNVKTAKGRKILSTKWLYRHINDPYVALAKEHGYKSRAAFKLIEIDKKFHILQQLPGTEFVVLDLGCAPGGWLQVLNRELPKSARIIGIDLQDVSADQFMNTIIINGDFSEKKTIDAVCKYIDNNLSLILSDMATSSCGNKQIDHIRLIDLANMILDFAGINLVKGGGVVMKIIQGNLSQSLFMRAKGMFKSVKWHKPKSSYLDSAEIYLVMQNKIQ